MEVEHSAIPGVSLVRPIRTLDHRGWFTRTYDCAIFAELGFSGEVVQENHSLSGQGTLRGLHVRADLTEAKTVRVLRGALFDVVVDLRPWSPTFLQHVVLDLSAHDPTILVVAPGCAHGFLALGPATEVLYQVTAAYDPGLDVTIAWDDPQLAISWPIETPTLSDRDRQASSLTEVAPRFSDWFGARAPSP